MENRKFTVIDDSRWADLAKNHDEDAFNHLVLAHQDAAFNLANWMLHGDDVAEDIVQTAFLAAYRHIQDFRGKSFRAWLFKIIRNLCIDELRRRARHPNTQIGPLKDEPQELEDLEWLPDASPLPEDLIIMEEEQRMVTTCIHQLPDAMRDVLILIDLQDLNYQEAANVLNVRVGTIKSRLARARVRLRDLLLKTNYVPSRIPRSLADVQLNCK